MMHPGPLNVIRVTLIVILPRLQETSSEGAARETREEALAEVSVVAPYSYWDIPQIGQVSALNTVLGDS